MFGKSQELAVLCAIGAEVPANGLIDGKSFSQIMRCDGFRFVAADPSPRNETYRCGVVPAVLFKVAHQSGSVSKDIGNSTVPALVRTLFDTARLLNSPGEFESFLHAYFTLAWGQRSRDTLRSAFPCLTADTPLRPITQYRTVSHGTLGSALSFKNGEPYVVTSKEGDVLRISAAPTSIHLCGTGDNAQPGFDIMMFQPRTSESPAALVLIEAKYSRDTMVTTRLVPSDVKSKVEQCVVELAPFLPGMRLNT